MIKLYVSLLLLILTLSSNNYGDSFIQLPFEIDWRISYPNCFEKIDFQEKCNYGFAFALADLLSTRLCIKNQGKSYEKLSALELISCDDTGKNTNCQIGNLENALNYISKFGLHKDTCIVNNSIDGVLNRECGILENITCDNVTKIKENSIKMIDFEGMIMQELTFNGPVIASFQPSEDFIDYKGGFYSNKYGNIMNLQTVLIVGFKREARSGYWILKNSFGENWGEKGYFKVKFGELIIEKNALTFEPLIK